MSNLKDLQERKNELVVEVRTLGKEFNENDKRWKDQEQENRWNTVNNDLTEVEKQIEEARSASEVEDRLNALDEMERESQRERSGQVRPGSEDRSASFGSDRNIGDSGPLAGYDDEQTRALAFSGWLRSGREQPTEEESAAMERAGINARNREIAVPPPSSQFTRGLQTIYRTTSDRFRQRELSEFAEKRDVGVSAGAGLIPTQLLSSLEIEMLAFGGMLQVSDILRTSGGGAVDWPTADDTGNTGALLAEATTIGSSVDPTFSKLTLDAYKYSSKPILVSYEILQDAIVNLPNVIGSMLGERLGRIANTHLTTGTGTGQPNGFVTASSAGVTAASATAFTEEELIDLVHSVDPAYRSAPGVRFMLNDAVLAYIRKFQDSQGQFLWQPGMRMGEPDMVYGYGYTINQDMSSTFTTGQRLVAFGDFSKYKVRMAGPTRLRRLDERYADTDQVAFIAFMRMDGDLATTSAIKTLDLA